MWASSSLLALWSAAAHAGACCVGTTTGVPGRLGPLEHVLVGGDVGGEFSVARWRADRSVGGASPRDEALALQLGVGVRLTRAFQLVLSAPLRADFRQATGISDRGVGFGDVGLSSFWMVGWEGHRANDHAGAPAVSVVLGTRFPTGRSWLESDSPLLADVTGRPGVGLRAGLIVERTLGSHPWYVQLDSDVPVPSGSPLISASVGVGKYFGTKWTLMGSASWQHTFGAADTERSTLAVRLIRGERLRWRAWGLVAADLPIPGAGMENPINVSISAGAAWVH